MDLRQLSHFVAVAEDESFTRAAQRMNIVQSGISHSIASLERDLGVQLFRRSKHHVQLTASGHALLLEARRALAAVAAGRAAAISSQSALGGTLRIGLARAFPRFLELPRLIQQFHLSNPDVSLHITELGSDPNERLRDGSLDLVIGPRRTAQGIGTLALASAQLLLACAADHPLASRRSLSIESLDGEQFIDLPSGWLVRTITDRALADAQVSRGTLIEVANLSLALQLVAERTGVVILPDLGFDLPTGIALVPFRPSIGSWEMAVSFLGDQPVNAAAYAFLRLLQVGSGQLHHIPRRPDIATAPED